METKHLYMNRQHECDWAEMRTFGKFTGCRYGWTKCSAPQAKGWAKLRCPYYFPPQFKEEDQYVKDDS